MDQKSKKWIKIKKKDQNPKLDQNPIMDQNPKLDQNCHEVNKKINITYTVKTRLELLMKHQ